MTLPFDVREESETIQNLARARKVAMRMRHGNASRGHACMHAKAMSMCCGRPYPVIIVGRPGGACHCHGLMVHAAAGWKPNAFGCGPGTAPRATVGCDLESCVATECVLSTCTIEYVRQTKCFLANSPRRMISWLMQLFYLHSSNSSDVERCQSTPLRLPQDTKEHTLDVFRIIEQKLPTQHYSGCLISRRG